MNIGVKKWVRFKDKILDAAEECCGTTQTANMKIKEHTSGW